MHFRLGGNRTGYERGETGSDMLRRRAYILAFGDTQCLDDSHRTSGNTCFRMLTKLLQRMSAGTTPLEFGFGEAMPKGWSKEHARRLPELAEAYAKVSRQASSGIGGIRTNITSVVLTTHQVCARQNVLTYLKLPHNSAW